MLVEAVGALAAVTFGPPRSNTFIFVIVPPLSWLLSAAVVAGVAVRAHAVRSAEAVTRGGASAGDIA